MVSAKATSRRCLNRSSVTRFVVAYSRPSNRHAADPCGSELARDSHLSVNMYVEFEDAIASKLNWSSNSGHRLRCLCRFLLHGYWRQVVVVAVEPGAVVVHEEADHVGLCFLARAIAAARHPF